MVVLDRANQTIDILRSKLAASEKDRRAAWDDAYRLRDRLAILQHHTDDPFQPQPQQQQQQQQQPQQPRMTPADYAALAASRYFVPPARADIPDKFR